MLIDGQKDNIILLSRSIQKKVTTKFRRDLVSTLHSQLSTLLKKFFVADNYLRFKISSIGPLKSAEIPEGISFSPLIKAP